MKNKYLGRWRIVEMEKWDPDFIDLVVPGYIQCEEDDSGEFQFGSVFGSMECRIGTSDTTERLEFSWDGEDETDSLSGRGWARVNQDGQLEGRLYFHDGDDSGFMAERNR